MAIRLIGSLLLKQSKQKQIFENKKTSVEVKLCFEKNCQMPVESKDNHQSADATYKSILVVKDKQDTNSANQKTTPLVAFSNCLLINGTVN